MHEPLIFTDGVGARSACQPRSTCPYPPSTPQWAMWCRGWDWADACARPQWPAYQPEERANHGPGWDDNGVLHDPTQGGRAKL